MAAEPARYLSRADAEALARKVLGFATADETRVVIQSGARMSTRFAVNQITTSGDRFDVTVQVRSTVGKRNATATTNSLDDASLKRVVESSEKLARLSPEDPEAVPELGPQQYLEPR